ncbi:pyridoxal phosphate-dependent aminotransferase [Desulfatitalea alkaliphila]|uniref:alanine transaminase n=1 Tax=Desulfatitalea alkaliphila TaxID=2929485 RepID=A0AA41UMW6_9BACT|nr:pyridoxal phosphate-dependent aminotransferase [Desulfatitalea alkaliphila]MCJ8498973.1 pyridoxal phosphate-dependent aminotransferase [Desulfatitalea alkaliphila]
MRDAHFSKRFEWNAPANALARLVARKQAEGIALNDLTRSNPTRVGLDYPTAAILAALASPAAMTYRPDPRGLATARQAIAAYYAAQGICVSADALYLTASTSEAYAMLFKLLADPADEVLIPVPGYPLLGYLARFEGVSAVAYPCRWDPHQGWSIDLEVLEALITPRTRAVVVISPNNPTGAYAGPAALAALDRIARRHGLALIVDEVFADYPAPATPAAQTRSALADAGALTFVLNGFSKMLALPQVKLGWIAVGGHTDLVRSSGSRLETLLDFYLSPGTPVQHAAPSLLALRRIIQAQVHSRLAANRRLLQQMVGAVSHCRLLPCEGGWYAVLEIDDALGDEARVLRLLERHNTLVHPGLFYDFNREGVVVLSLLPPPETFRAGIDHLIAMDGDAPEGY